MDTTSFKAPEESLYKKSPVLKIFMGKKYQSNEDDVLIMGVKKLGIICDQIDYIRTFVEKHSKKEQDCPAI
ncbi:MAG: hypothetical protein ACOYOS_19315 [Syntrophales bacterium]